MRQYLTLKAEGNLLHDYGNLAALRRRTFEILQGLGAPGDLLDLLASIEVEAAPSLNANPPLRDEPAPDELIISYSFPDVDAAANVDPIKLLRDFLGKKNHLGELTQDAGAVLRNIGADPRAHFCSLFPAAPARPFGNRSRVREMMGTGDLRGLTGRGVNVVIIDQGLNEGEITARYPASWGGGLVPASIVPGSAPRTSHGTMIARNILDIAPEAIVYDVPLIPPHISRPGVFASTAHATFKAVLDKIRLLKKQRDAESAWILVNAWAIFDRAGEWPPEDYTRNKHVNITKLSLGQFEWELGHPLNRIMNTAVKEGLDVVFGAGNCGQFTSSSRCGRHDRGEGCSIWGANAHPEVLTVGAVSANGQWLGYSSQGPGAWGNPEKPWEKPDVCTPSHFCEDNDPSTVNSGTSAATGLAAGVIAAIRSNWGPDKKSPSQIKEAINASARGENGVWNNRTGNGILNAGALLKQLSTPH